MRKPVFLISLFSIMMLASVMLAAASEALPPELTLVQCSNPFPFRLYASEQSPQVLAYAPPNAFLYLPSASVSPHLRYWVLAKARLPGRGLVWVVGWIDTSACQR